MAIPVRSPSPPTPIGMGQTPPPANPVSMPPSGREGKAAKKAAKAKRDAGLNQQVRSDRSSGRSKDKQLGAGARGREAYIHEARGRRGARSSKADARYTTGKYKGMTVGEADGVDMDRYREMPEEQRDKFRDVNNADIARNELAAKKKDEEAYQLGRKRADINAADKHKRDKLYGTGSTGGTPNPASDPNAPQTPETAQRGAKANDPSMGGGDTASPDFNSNKSEGYWAKQAGGASKEAPKPSPVKNVAEAGVPTEKTEFEVERAKQDEQAQNLIDDKIQKREDLTAASQANQDAVDATAEKKYADGKTTRLAERSSGQVARDADPALQAAHDKAGAERQKKRDYKAANPSMIKSMTSSDPKVREGFNNTLLGRSVDEVKEIAQPIVSGIKSAGNAIANASPDGSLLNSYGSKSKSTKKKKQANPVTDPNG